MHRVRNAAAGAAGLAFAALAVCGCPPSPEPRPPHVGGADAGAPIVAGPVWKAKSFVRAAEGCTQTWSCDCSAVARHGDCRAVPSADATTTGACAADTGPVNGCTRCLALPPPAACECRSECP